MGDELFAGSLIALSSKMAEVRLDQPVATLDNLLKGAATQALQNLNLAFGLEELEGIPR